VSAAAVRAPASTAAVARHYLGLLGSYRGVVGLLLPLGLTLFGGMNAVWFAGLGPTLVLAIFFAMFQWRGTAGRDVLDAALPVDRTRHHCVRVACGAAWAAAALALCIGVYTALAVTGHGGWGGYPYWYPAALLASGLTLYLFGAAVWLRAEHPGRVLLLLCLSPLTWPLDAGVLLSGTETPEALRTVSPAVRLGTIVLWLALACAAVWLSASADRWLPRAAAALPPRLRALAGGPRRRRALPAAGRPTGVRRPASLLTVFRRDLALVGNHARWVVFLAAVSAWQVLRMKSDATWDARAAGSPLGGHAAILSFLQVLAFFWPLLVWVDERGPGSDHADSVPTGTLARRLLRVAAGAAWLVPPALLVAAGVAGGARHAGRIPSLADAPSWLWIAVPCGALLTYLVGSIPVLLSPRHPFRSAVIGWFVFTITRTLLVGRDGLENTARLSPITALATAMGVPMEHWGQAMLVWLPLAAALATLFAAVSVRSDRGGIPNPIVRPAT